MAEPSSHRITLAVLRTEIQHGFAEINRRLERIENKQAEQNGALRDHQVRIALLEDQWHSQTQPALRDLADARTQLAALTAKYAAIGLGGAGGITGVVLVLGKAWGWW